MEIRLVHNERMFSDSQGTIKGSVLTIDTFVYDLQTWSIPGRFMISKIAGIAENRTSKKTQTA